MFIIIEGEGERERDWYVAQKYMFLINGKF